MACIMCIPPGWDRNSRSEGRMSMGKLLASQNDTSSSFTCLASCHQLLGRLNRLYLGIEVSKLSDSSSSNSLFRRILSLVKQGLGGGMQHTMRGQMGG
mmetsp:Transcript_1235/g.2668  ORF Transcript_1235/g.2668 Transcript_1235/m.2668 type:complete len:98 (-) Transcript_1235:122-415(-)